MFRTTLDKRDFLGRDDVNDQRLRHQRFDETSQKVGTRSLANVFKGIHEDLAALDDALFEHH